MKTHAKFPLFLPGLKLEKNNNIRIIAGEISHEQAILAEYFSKDGVLKCICSEAYDFRQFTSLSEIFQKFMNDKCLEKPHRISLGVAGPVIDGKSKASYFPWVLDVADLKRDIEVEEVIMLNDLESIAYSLCDCEDCISIVRKGNAEAKGNVAILAPGSGLGESGLFWDGEFLHPFASEGGHTEFSPRSDEEIDFYQFLHEIYGIVTWENVLSKKGMFNIYRFLRDLGRHQEPNWFTEKYEKEGIVDAVVDSAKEKNAFITALTIEKYIDFLAREANSLVLKLKATGGLVITGEIALKIEDFLLKEDFYKKFIISDKMEYLLKDIPIYIFKNESSVILGAANYAAFSKV